MPKFVRVAIIVCLSLAVLFGSLRLWLGYKTAQVESFYQEHRLLRDMRTVQTESTNDSALAREAILGTLPLGTDKDKAVAVLRNEGFGCQDLAEPITDTRLRRRFLEAGALAAKPTDNRTKKVWVDCQVGTPNIIGYKHWIVDLEFDADAHLSDAGVAIWNISL
jgi:hypothetical protein